MWNSFRTDARLSITAEVITYAGGHGDEIHAYFARPIATEPTAAVPGIVAVHHMPGWDEFYREFSELWGGGVVMAKEELSEARPVAPIDYTVDLTAPLLGLFGNDDTQSSSARNSCSSASSIKVDSSAGSQGPAQPYQIHGRRHRCPP